MARLTEMKRMVQELRFCVVGVCLIFSQLCAQEYRSPQVTKSIFSDQLGMLNREREEYGKNIAIYAANLVVAAERKDHSLAIASRLIGLSLHLAPNNGSAVGLDRRLKNGEIPPREKVEYSDAAFSGLLFERSKSLMQQAGRENTLLAYCLVELSAMIDPKNKAAVEKAELQKIERGSFPWRTFTQSQSSK